MNNAFTNEPALTIGAAVLAVVNSGIALLPLFGVDIDVDQQIGLGAFITSIVTLATILTRSRVIPTENAVTKTEANAAIRDAFQSDPNVGKAPVIK